MEKILFTSDSGEEISFYVLEQTKINGIQYILVTDAQEDEGDALIMKEMVSEEGAESIYEIVEDDIELHAVADIFSSLLEDIEFVDED